ncbi:MAG: AMP-binding protein [Desulforhopalus sp.]
MEPSADTPYSLDQALWLRTATRQVRKDNQLHLLKKHLQQAARIPFYKEMFTRTGGSGNVITDPAMLSNLPFTTRADIDFHPELFGLQDEKAIRDIALTSGTTGEPVIVSYTAADLHRLAFNESVAFYSAGVRRGDRVLLTVTLDRCFVAGLAYYSGVTLLGATAIRSGPGQPARQWQIIKKLQPKVIVGVPSFLLELGQWGQENSINVGKSSVATIITIGEPARKPDFRLTEIGLQLEELWGAKIFSSYGATEFETAFGECSASSGGHVHPELMLVEVIDDEGNILPDGEPGEVVVTPLGVEGFPLIRFRTGDIARLNSSPCSCGWQTKRLGPIEGRLAQRLKFRGTTLYPETIFHALQNLLEVKAAYVEVRRAADGTDDVTVVAGCDGQYPNQDKIEERLQAHLRVRPRLVIKKSAEVHAVMVGDDGRKPRKYFDFRV